MITSLEGPIVEVIRFRFDARPGDLKGFVDNMMNALPLPAKQNTDGAPAMLIFDSSKPLGGLSSLGHDGVAALTGTGSYFADMEEGDLLVIQARANKPLTGGGTVLGVLRSALYEEAVAAKLLPQDHSLHFAWVTGFPMFTVNDGVDPGQGGEAGFQSTHHPFTAPLTPEDFELLASDPLQARADHYDLVLNGVELGGGSRRIHVAAVQEYVMREILQMPEERIGQFAHLLSALRAGCPPHAGFALGFDRLVAVLSGTKSVRDVIAFPKSKKGDDAMVGSPSAMTEAQLKTYNLSLRRA
jgi:aspartyl-tRNA synthetase